MLALPLLLAVTPLPTQTVWTVDIHGSGDFTDIQSAIDAAADGDTIFIVDPERLTYATTPVDGFELVGKGLTILAASEGTWRVDTSLIRDVPADSRVVIQGLAFATGMPAGYPVCSGDLERHQPSTDPYGLRITGCAGAVSLEHCCMHGAEDAGLIVEDSDLVLLRWVQTEGGLQASKLGSPPGLHVLRSRVDASECRFVGGKGPAGYCEGLGCSYCEPGTNGGPGAMVGEGGSLRAVSSSFEGGSGGMCGFCYSCDAGPGMGIVAASDATVTIQDCELDDGWWGTDRGIFLGPVDIAQLPARTLTAPGSVGPDGEVEFEFAGAPGELALLLLSPTAGVYGLGLDGGVLLVGQPIPGGRRRAGALDAAGRLATTVSLCDPFLSGADVIYAQAAFVGASGVRLSDAHAIVRVGVDAPFLAAGEPLRVAPSSATPGVGRTWDEPVVGLHEVRRRSLHHAGAPSDIWFLEGTYTPGPPGSDPSTHDHLFPLGVTVRGGFRGDERSPEERNPADHPTIVSGDLAGNDGPDGSNRGENAGVCLLWRSPWEWCAGPNVELESVIVENFGEYDRENAKPIELGGRLLLRDCVVRGNATRSWYGILRLHGSASRLRSIRTRWTGNRGLLWTGRTGLELRDSVIVGNRAPIAIAPFADYDSIEIVGSTVAGNVIDSATGGAIVQSNGTSTYWNEPAFVQNTILWQNSAGGVVDESAQIQLRTNQTAPHDVGWCLIDAWSGTSPGVGILTADPAFVDRFGPDGIAWSGDEDLRLAAGSPCIDAGNSLAVGPEPAFDIDGLPRRVDDPAAPDVGNGPPPLPDIGAHERQ